MKRILLAVIVMFLVSSAPSEACCEGGGERLLNGIKNFTSAPLEIPKKVAYYSAETGYHPYGIAAGFGEGGAATAQKFIAGLIQILTFPFDSSEISYDLH